MQSIHFVADVKLLDFIQKKLDKLDSFYDRITGGEVYLRLNKDSDAKENKIVEVKINLPGHTLFVKEVAATFEAATDVALDSLKNQLKKYKEKKAVRPVAIPDEVEG